MPKKIKIGITFEFDPQGEHDFLFEGMPFDAIVKDATRMAIDDIYNLVASGEIARQISVEVIED